MIYVLLLQQNKIYVGYSDRPIGDRFIEHFNFKGSKWTTLYRPLQVLQVQPGGLDAENQVTLRMMDTYGWWNVRGGSWCQVDIHQCPPALLEWQRLKLPTPLRQNQPRASPSKRYARNVCSKCGRDSHSASNCYAKTSVSHPVTKSYAKTKASSLCNKNTTKGCTRCGRDSHTVSQCFAKTRADDKASQECLVSNTGGCYRCGRNTHFAKDCFAKTDIKGIPL